MDQLKNVDRAFHARQAAKTANMNAQSSNRGGVDGYMHTETVPATCRPCGSRRQPRNHSANPACWRACDNERRSTRSATAGHRPPPRAAGGRGGQRAACAQAGGLAAGPAPSTNQTAGPPWLPANRVAPPGGFLYFSLLFVVVCCCFFFFFFFLFLVKSARTQNQKPINLLINE